MPLYIHCPHCEFPTVLRKVTEGHRYRCRQCSGVFVLQFRRASRGRQAPCQDNGAPDAKGGQGN
jgi:hypothetical protein